MSTDQESKASSRTRSPAYPIIPLKTAIERAAVLYKHEKRNLAHVDVVIRHWELDPKSSSGLRSIAALKQFGLIEEVGKNDDRQVKLSSLGFNILMPEVAGSTEYENAVKTAALLPTLHADIWKQYNGELPSDAALSRYLILSKNFNDSVVAQFVRQFKATVAFAKLAKVDTIADESDEDSANSQDENRHADRDARRDENLGGGSGNHPFTNTFNQFFSSAQQKPKGQTGTPTGPTMRDLPITLPSLAVAILRLPCPMTEEDFQTLSAMLTAYKPSLTKKPSRDPNPDGDHTQCPDNEE